MPALQGHGRIVQFDAAAAIPVKNAKKEGRRPVYRWKADYLI